MRSPGYVCDHVTETLVAMPTGSEDCVCFVSTPGLGIQLCAKPDTHVRPTCNGEAGGLKCAGSGETRAGGPAGGRSGRRLIAGG